MARLFKNELIECGRSQRQGAYSQRTLTLDTKRRTSLWKEQR
jgi:hypothetical protein